MEGEPAIDIAKYHAFRKYKKNATSVLQDDGTDFIVHRPSLRSDLIGGEKGHRTLLGSDVSRH